MNIPEHIISEASQCIINTRQFCGSEWDAVREFAVENGITVRADQAKLFRIAKFRANAEWRRWQRLAGVPEKHIW